MRYKYLISLKKEDESLLIQEYCELDKDTYSLVCEETYNSTAIQTAVNHSLEALINEIRTRHIYPSGFFCARIGEAIRDVFNSGAELIQEIYCDDVDYLTKKQHPKIKLDEIEEDEMEEDADDANALIEDDFTDDFEDDINAKVGKKNIRVADADDAADD